MLTKEQKNEIDRLRKQGSNISQIAKQMNLDWKTVKGYLSQHSQGNIGPPSRNNNQLDENELTKVIFQKLNAEIPPEIIVGEIGYVDLLTSLYQKRRSLRRLTKSDSPLLNPQMIKSFDTWEKSYEKHNDWHFERAIRAVGEDAYQRMILCVNYKNRGKCNQIGNIDPYECVSCYYFFGVGVS